MRVEIKKDAENIFDQLTDSVVINGTTLLQSALDNFSNELTILKVLALFTI